jgi:hypothetical protein
MRSLKLRYVLLIALEPQGSIHKVSELVDYLLALGVDLGALPRKFVSNLLCAERTEVGWNGWRRPNIGLATFHARLATEPNSSPPA